MTEATVSTSALHGLQGINGELATLLHAARAELAAGSEAALSDDLVVCGILGGKDVGKSTLINALAKAPVSVDDAEVGEGTDRPMVYVHEASREAAAQRLSAIDRHVPLDVDVPCKPSDATVTVPETL